MDVVVSEDDDGGGDEDEQCGTSAALYEFGDGGGDGHRKHTARRSLAGQRSNCLRPRHYALSPRSQSSCHRRHLFHHRPQGKSRRCRSNVLLLLT